MSSIKQCGTIKGTIRPQAVMKGKISRTIETIDPVIQPLEVTENGEYSASEGVHGFNPVNVNVPLKYEEGYNDGYQASQDSITLQEKTITENGEYETDEGFTGMSKVIVAVPIKKEQEKTVEITKNGTTEVIADEGKSMSKVTVNTNVAFEGDIGKPYIDSSKISYFAHFFRYNTLLIDDIDNLDTSNGTDFSYMFYNCSSLTTIPQLDTSKGTTFYYMFYNCSSLTTIPQLDTSNGTDFSNMFNTCKALLSIPQLDTSSGTGFSNMFNECRNLKSVPQLDTSKGTNFSNMFYNCKALLSIPQLDISNGTTYSYMFRGCSRLETVSITTAKSNLSTSTFQNCTALKNITIGEGWAVNIYLHYSNNLTVESLHGMIENLADLTGQTAKTFQIGPTNLAKVDEAHLEMLKAKNWDYK